MRYLGQSLGGLLARGCFTTKVTKVTKDSHSFATFVTSRTPNARAKLHGIGTRKAAETGRMGSEEMSRDIG